jgi:hypothetical protein
MYDGSRDCSKGHDCVPVVKVRQTIDISYDFHVSYGNQVMYSYNDNYPPLKTSVIIVPASLTSAEYSALIQWMLLLCTMAYPTSVALSILVIHH